MVDWKNNRKKKKLKSWTTNRHIHRHWCINTFAVTYFYMYCFSFHKCANWHILLLSQINLTWLRLHQFAGFLRRHRLHPKCVHVSYGKRKTHVSCHSGYLSAENCYTWDSSTAEVPHPGLPVAYKNVKMKKEGQKLYFVRSWTVRGLGKGRT